MLLITACLPLPEAISQASLTQAGLLFDDVFWSDLGLTAAKAGPS